MLLQFVQQPFGDRLQMGRRRAYVADSRCHFDSLCDELVSNILNRLPCALKLLEVPMVCRRWHALSLEPLFWQIIDFDLHHSFYSGSRKDDGHIGVGIVPHSSGDVVLTSGLLMQGQQQIERMIAALVPRSGTYLREFTLTYNLFPIERALRLISERGHGQLLQTLRIPGAKLTDECVCEVASCLPSITELNITRCYPLSGVGLQAFGEHCKSLSSLFVTLDEEKCLSISQHMTNLRELHARYEHRPSRKGIHAIIAKCKRLRLFLFDYPCHEPHLSKRFLHECMMERTSRLVFGCICCRFYEWDCNLCYLLERVTRRLKYKI